MRTIANDFLDMFLRTCEPGCHEFTVVFGDDRSVRQTTITRSVTRWPHTFLDQSFMTVWRMLDAWLVGRDAFVTVRSVPEGGVDAAMLVEEIRCWVLTPLGAIPYDAVDASAACDQAGDVTVFNLDRGLEERFMDAWDADFRFSLSS